MIEIKKSVLDDSGVCFEIHFEIWRKLSVGFWLHILEVQRVFLWKSVSSGLSFKFGSMLKVRIFFKLSQTVLHFSEFSKVREILTCLGLQL